MMVTHRLNEVRDWCDRVVVLRDGAVVHDGPASDASARTLVRHIMGSHAQADADNVAVLEILPAIVKRARQHA